MSPTPRPSARALPVRHVVLLMTLLLALGAVAAPAQAAPGTRHAGVSVPVSVAATPVSVAATAAERAVRVRRLGGVPVRLRRDTAQVVTVRHTGGYRARVVLWERRGELRPDGRRRWKRVLATSDGRIGYGGLVRGDRRRQGTGTTPVGTYSLPSSFGTHRRKARWDTPYRKIRRGDYWVQDNRSAHYNRLRNRRRGGFRWWLPSSDPNSSERLLDYRKQYEMAVVVGFNLRQVRHRGSGIFLHVNGRGATAGCVSVPRRTMRRIVARLDPALSPRIAIGPARRGGAGR